MTRALIAVLVFVALPAPAQKAAPFSAEAEGHFEGTRGTVTVRFGEELSEVTIELYGVSGLVVTGPGQLEPGRFPKLVVKRDSVKRGERVPVAVEFTPGEGESSLVLAVGTPRGSFVPRTFSIGQPSEAQRRKNAEGVQVDPRGQRIKVMKASPPRYAGVDGLVEVSGDQVDIVANPKSRSRVSYRVTGAKKAALAELAGQTVSARGQLTRSGFTGTIAVSWFQAEGAPVDFTDCAREADEEKARFLTVVLSFDGTTVSLKRCTPLEARRRSSERGELSVELQDEGGAALFHETDNDARSLRCGSIQAVPLPPGATPSAGAAGTDDAFVKASPEHPTSIELQIPVLPGAAMLVWTDRVECGKPGVEPLAKIPLTGE